MIIVDAKKGLFVGGRAEARFSSGSFVLSILFETLPGKGETNNKKMGVLGIREAGSYLPPLAYFEPGMSL